jgi:uncharacterized protein (DUF1778 family)
MDIKEGYNMNVKERIKTERLEIRLTPEQKQELKRQASELNISITEHIINTLSLSTSV